MLPPASREVLVTDKWRVADAEVCVGLILFKGTPVYEVSVGRKDSGSAPSGVDLVASIGPISAMACEPSVASSEVQNQAYVCAAFCDMRPGRLNEGVGCIDLAAIEV